MLVTGPNGAGKTNLVEGIHLACQGFSFRTRADAQLIRHGCSAASAAVEGARGSVPTSADVRLELHGSRRVRLNGAIVSSSDTLRARLQALVFTPDRLAVVKAGPAARRAYFDRALGRLFPARATLPIEYGAALGQRNAALRRIAAGLSDRAALAPWDATVVELGTTLVEARHAAVDVLGPAFSELAAKLGLDDARIAYGGAPITLAQLEDGLARDLERGTTGRGPHLDEVPLLAGTRDLRSFGSQGEQRLAVLALVLAEAEALTARGGVAPLLLLDDALSELDERRRRILSERLGRHGQTIVTATGAEALPLAPAQLLRVGSGTVENG